MDRRCFQSRLGVAMALAFALTCMTGDFAFAACLAQIDQPVIGKFLADPARILKDNPNGGPAMIAALRDLAVANPGTLQPIIGLLPSANAAQKAAVGTAFGQAARACLTTHAAYAAEIQEQLAASGDEPAILALAVVMGNVPIGVHGR